MSKSEGCARPTPFFPGLILQNGVYTDQRESCATRLMKKTSLILVVFLLSLPLLSSFETGAFKPITAYLLIYLVPLCLIIFLWGEQNNLKDFNINRTSFNLSIYFYFCLGSIVRIVRAFTTYGYTTILLSFILTLPVFITGILLYKRNKKEILVLGKTSLKETRPIAKGIFIGLLINTLLTLPAILIAAPNPQGLSLASLAAYSFGEFFINQLSLTVIPEELVYRGLLWGSLRKLGWSQLLIVIVQSIFFWLGHINSAQSFFLFISIPVLSLFFGYLVVRSNSITTSILAHASINLMNQILRRLIFPP